MSDKPPFDPNQPFEAANVTKPTFDPNQPFQEAAAQTNQVVGNAGAHPDAPWEDKISGEAFKGSDSLERGLVKGLSFNLAPKATAALDALKSKLEGSDSDYSDLYNKSLGQTKALYDQAQKNNPKTYAASQLAGSVASSLLPGVNIAGAGSLGGAAVRGAIQGGVSSFGDANGTPQNELKQIAIGSGVGGGLGAAGYQLSKYLSKVAPKFAENATGATGREQQLKFKPDSGQKLLDNGIVQAGDTPSSIADKASAALENSSNSIGDSLSEVKAPIQKSDLLTNLAEQREMLANNPGNRSAVKKLDLEIQNVVETMPDNISAQDGWDAKKAFDNKVNWLTQKLKPSQASADRAMSNAFRGTVEDGVANQSPELAQKFAQDRGMYSFLKPIQEASEREAATLNQRKVGGMLDTAAGVGGGLLGAFGGQGDMSHRLENGLAGAAIGAAGRRLLVPRLASTFAAAANSPVTQNLAGSIPQLTGRSVWGNIMNGGNK